MEERNSHSPQVKRRRKLPPKLELYQMIISQLINDGFPQAAQAVSEAAMVPQPADMEEQRLATLVESGLRLEAKGSKGYLSDSMKEDRTTMPSIKGERCLDFDSEADKEQPIARVFPNFSTRFITTHKNSCRCAQFSPDGSLVATGSSDTSIKLIDVEKMKTFSQTKDQGNDEFSAARPVTRTFYDHTQAVHDLAFHPYSPILVSCSKDCTIKFYDHSKASAKRAFRYLQDTHPIRSISFHPSGDFILAGTVHHMIRLYDVNTFQAYTCANAKEHHFAAINMVRYATEGKMYVSCSKDGSIKLWDPVSSRCIKTIPSAHQGTEVTSVQFSMNNKYLLSGGRDATVRLWEVSTGRQLHLFASGSQKVKRQHGAFSYGEDFVLSCDENGWASLVWDARSGELLQRLSGHNNRVRFIAVSPVENVLLTCSDDHRARFWVGE